tara:strand:+ start:7187 stop:7651 length:465 start_codon:yes stop_codon:yes gene_type:complete
VSPPADPPSKDEIEATVKALMAPADVRWIMARVAALLSPYFDKDTPQMVREIEADDWAEALEKYPEWAITKAVRWWKSEANPNRRKRPLEGDIADRIKHEMRAVKGMALRLESGIMAQRAEERQRVIYDTPTEERRKQAAEIMARFKGVRNDGV